MTVRISRWSTASHSHSL